MAKKDDDNKMGKAVRRAMDGPDVTHDQIIDFALAQNEADRKRASSAGESRAEIKAFLDKTGLNSKAASWGRVILKKLDMNEGQGKAMDIISSMKKILPMIEAHVRGQGQADMDLEPDQEPVEPAAFDDPPAAA